MKKLLLLFAALTLVACSTAPSAPPITGSAALQFFEPASGDKGTVFLTCGKWITKSPILDSENDSPFCDFVVNGKAYTRLKKGTVGRIDLPVGTHTFTQGEESMAVSVPIKVGIYGGDVILAIANYTHKTGLLGGAMSGNHVFTIEIEKTNVIGQAKSKTPASLLANQ